MFLRQLGLLVSGKGTYFTPTTATAMYYTGVQFYGRGRVKEGCMIWSRVLEPRSVARHSWAPLVCRDGFCYPDFVVKFRIK